LAMPEVYDFCEADDAKREIVAQWLGIVPIG
jgi:hypothetical protein